MPRKQGADGRPTLLDSEKREVLLAGMRAGLRLQTAAIIAGISPSTAEEWKRRGEGRDHRPALPIYRQFADDVTLAKALAEAGALSHVWAQMPRDYKAAVFWLQKHVPEVYGDQQLVALAQQAVERPPQVVANVVVIPAAEAERLGLHIVHQQRAADGIASPDISALLVSGDSDQ